ncbi:hypothetical protein QP027_00720 [Corynebacterium breve]|uniref:Uncharacterized protein n=1 Tax=Corynebacterium breve TaxID=3049799 RepID=A0ABY8VG65_9CORY|nr:hypothetical protein [Corynebacterium breve]WIM67956.1 hypothetical protein QP027_00720 [Corynebacterium breve]
MTAELDYAFLAEYAKSDRGTLTVVGASFTEAQVSSYPGVVDIAVAGRVRRPEETEPPTLRIEIYAPSDQEAPQINFDFNLEDEMGAVRYDGKVASVFVFRGPVLIESAGLYVCNIFLDGVKVRRLAFEVVESQ